MGTIYKRKFKRKDGTEAEGKTWWVKYYRNGRAFYESSGSPKKSAARELLNRREGEIAGGKIPGIRFDRVTFDELAEALLTDYRVNGKDIHRLEVSVSHLRETFESMRVTEITTARVQAYTEKRLNEGVANATVNRELAALKRMLNMGAACTPPLVDRVPHIPTLKENNIRKGFFEHGEYLALRGVLPDHLKGFLTFGYKIGWRVSEISGLTWSKVDMNNGIVRLEPGDPKNDEARTVYLDDELKGIFREQQERRKALGTALPYVFLNEKGTDKIKRFDKSWKSACKRAKIGSRLFHDLRRTAVRNMVRAGIPERVAMMISGHKSRSVFERYNIVSDADLKRASAQQEKYLSEQTVTTTVTIHEFSKKEGASDGR